MPVGRLSLSVDCFGRWGRSLSAPEYDKQPRARIEQVEGEKGGLLTVFPGPSLRLPARQGDPAAPPHNFW